MHKTWSYYKTNGTKILFQFSNNNWKICSKTRHSISLSYFRYRRESNLQTIFQTFKSVNELGQDDSLENNKIPGLDIRDITLQSFQVLTIYQIRLWASFLSHYFSFPCAFSAEMYKTCVNWNNKKKDENRCTCRVWWISKFLIHRYFRRLSNKKVCSGSQQSSQCRSCLEYWTIKFEPFIMSNMFDLKPSFL